MSSRLSAEQCQVLEQILDLLIPGNPAKGIQSGNAPGVMSFLQQRLQEDDQLHAQVAGLLACASQTAVSADTLHQLQSDKPQMFASLQRLAYMAYYSRADARQQLGLAPWPVHPQGYQVDSETPEQLDALTAAVKARGRLYRPC